MQQSAGGAYLQRQAKVTPGEQSMNQADTWLSKDTQLKAEVDVLKVALREIKAEKSVSFNATAGNQRIDAIALILGLDATATKSLKDTWDWLVKNRKSKTQAAYQTQERALFRAMKSPLTTVGESYPQSQTKYWLKNTPTQVADIIHDVADAELPADQLYAYAAKEGLIDYVRDEIGLNQTAEPTKAQLQGVKTNKPVSGFVYLGLDDFMTDLGAKREPLGGFLPPGFDMTKVKESRKINEKKREVRSIETPNLKMAIQALSAMMKRRRKLFVEDAKAYGYKTPTTDELVYWTYVYFNSGEFGGKEQLKQHKGKRSLSDWIKQGAYPNAIKLLQSYQMLVKMKIF